MPMYPDATLHPNHQASISGEAVLHLQLKGRDEKQGRHCMMKTATQSNQSEQLFDKRCFTVNRLD